MKVDYKGSFDQTCDWANTALKLKNIQTEITNDRDWQQKEYINDSSQHKESNQITFPWLATSIWYNNEEKC